MAQFTAWPPTEPFPESLRDSTGGLGPDFPTSGGDRERGKFRAARLPRLTTLAVVNDDGSEVGSGLQSDPGETVLLLKAMVLGLSITTDTDLLMEVSAS